MLLARPLLLLRWVLGAQLCVEEELPEDCRSPRHAFLRLLQLSCKHCSDSSCEPVQELQETAVAVLEDEEAACVQGRLSAALVLLQVNDFRDWYKDFFQDFIKIVDVEGPPYDLAPFPFNKEAWRWYYDGGFRPSLAVGRCGAKPERGETKLVLHVKPLQIPCPYTFHDELLMQRCSQRASSVKVIGSKGKSSEDVAWVCPKLQWTPLHSVSYDGRSCESPSGSWGWDISARLKCVLVGVAELLAFRPGQTILDWGSGCGWFLSWAETFYGTKGFGIDTSSTATTWAQRFSLGSFCNYGGLDLTWIPSESFDYVTSFWALYHLTLQDQCEIIGQLVEKLKVGGKLWLGGNCPDEELLEGKSHCLKPEAMMECLASWEASPTWQRQGVACKVEIVKDVDLFRTMENRHEQVQGDYLFWGHCYSAFITRE